MRRTPSKSWELIHDIDIKFAMLTTVHADGTLHSRPMTTQQLEFDGNLRFFSGLNSEKVQELAAHPEVTGIRLENGGEREELHIHPRDRVLKDRVKPMG